MFFNCVKCIVFEKHSPECLKNSLCWLFGEVPKAGIWLKCERTHLSQENFGVSALVVSALIALNSGLQKLPSAS